MTSVLRVFILGTVDRLVGRSNWYDFGVLYLKWYTLLHAAYRLR